MTLWSSRPSNLVVNVGPGSSTVGGKLGRSALSNLAPHSMTPVRSIPGWSARQTMVGELYRDELAASFDDMELLEVCRLPGESVGMQLAIERTPSLGRTTVNEPRRVHVVTVTPGSPADRAFSSSSSPSSYGDGGIGGGLRRGDEIVEINGKNLRLVRSIDEVMKLIDELPLRLLLLVKRDTSKDASSEVDRRQHRWQRQNEEPKQSPRVEMDSLSNFTKQTCTPCFEHEGFERRRLEFRKAANEQFGLRLDLITIGFHKYYQIREILEGSLFARRRLLRVGDCLLSFNGTPLEGLDKVKCGRILTQNVVDVELEILREKPGRSMSQFSAITTTLVDDVPTSPPLSARLHHDQQPVDEAPRSGESWLKTSVDDIGFTNVDDCDAAERHHTTSASRMFGDPSELFAHAHNKLHHSSRSFATSSDIDQQSNRNPLDDDQVDVQTRRVESSTDNAASVLALTRSSDSTVGMADRPNRHNSDTVAERPLAVADGNTSRKWSTGSDSQSVDTRKGSSAKRKNLADIEPMDDRLLELTHRLATASAAAAAVSSTSSSSSSSSLYDAHPLRSRIGDVHGGRHWSPSPPPLPASSPPRTVTKSTSGPDFYEWSTHSDDEGSVSVHHVMDDVNDMKPTSTRTKHEQANDAMTDRSRNWSFSDWVSGIHDQRATTNRVADDDGSRNHMMKLNASESVRYADQMMFEERTPSKLMNDAPATKVDHSDKPTTSPLTMTSMTSPSVNEIEGEIKTKSISSYYVATAFDDATLEFVGSNVETSSSSSPSRWVMTHRAADSLRCVHQPDDIQLSSTSLPYKAIALSLDFIVKRLECDSLDGAAKTTPKITTRTETKDHRNYTPSGPSKHSNLSDMACASRGTATEVGNDSGVQPVLSAGNDRRPKPSGSNTPPPDAAVKTSAKKPIEKWFEIKSDDLQLREATERSTKASRNDGDNFGVVQSFGSTRSVMLAYQPDVLQRHKSRISAPDDLFCDETASVADINDRNRSRPAVGLSGIILPHSPTSTLQRAITMKPSPNGKAGSTVVYVGPPWSEERLGSSASSSTEGGWNVTDSESSRQSGGDRKRRYGRLKLHISVVTINGNSVLLTSTLTPVAYGPLQLPYQRTVGGLFQVTLLRSIGGNRGDNDGTIGGLGIRLTYVPEGVVVSDVVTSGPVGRDGKIRVGDYLLSVNGIDILNLKDEDELVDLFNHVPLGPIHLVVYAASSRSSDKSITNELKLSVARNVLPSTISQRIDSERQSPSLGIGPVTQVFGVNSEQMKIVCRTASPEEPTRLQRSQHSAELHGQDRTPLDAAGSTAQLPTSSMVSSDGFDNDKRDCERRLPPDGIDFEPENIVSALIQHAVIRKDTYNDAKAEVNT